MSQGLAWFCQGETSDFPGPIQVRLATVARTTPPRLSRLSVVHEGSSPMSAPHRFGLSFRRMPTVSLRPAVAIWLTRE